MAMKDEILVCVTSFFEVVTLFILFHIFCIYLIKDGHVILGIAVWLLALFLICCYAYYSCFHKIKQSSVVDSETQSSKRTSVNPNRDATNRFSAQPSSISIPLAPEAHSGVIFLN